MEEGIAAIKKFTHKLREGWVKADEPKVKVRNFVVSMDFGAPIDLEKVHRSFGNTEYEQEVFPGLVFRMDDPKATFLLFRGGKAICAGTTSEETARQAGERMVQILRSLK